MVRPVSPFHYADFRYLIAGHGLGKLGVQMLAVAIGWQIYDLTGSPFSIGLVGLCQFLPCLLLVFHAGHLADQLDRRLILGVVRVVAGLAALTLMTVTLTGQVSAIIIYAMAFLLGLVHCFAMPAGQALLPNVVPTKVFSSATAYNSTAFQIATVTGPAAASAAFFLGTWAVYGFAFLALLVSGMAALRIKTRVTRGPKRPLTLENLSAGLKFILARPVMLGAMTLDLFAVFFGGLVALLPIYARDILDVGPQGLGLLRSAPAVGAALMALFLARFAIKRRAGMWLLASVVVFGAATIVFGLSTHVALSALMLLVLGGVDMVSVYVRSHLMQLNTPDSMRGRVASVNMLFITSSNELGDFESGLMAGWLGPAVAVVFGGAMSILVAGFIAWRVPSLRKLSALTPPPPGGRVTPP